MLCVTVCCVSLCVVCCVWGDEGCRIHPTQLSEESTDVISVSWGATNASVSRVPPSDALNVMVGSAAAAARSAAMTLNVIVGASPGTTGITTYSKMTVEVRGRVKVNVNVKVNVKVNVRMRGSGVESSEDLSCL